MLLSSFAKRGEKTMNAYWSKLWVQQRIVPTDRQNLGQILKANGLNEYDEFELLMLGNGRCAQDSCYLVPIEEKIIEVKFRQRYEEKVEDVIPLKGQNLLVFFRNGAVKKCDIRTMKEEDRTFKPILTEEKKFQMVSVQTGGYGVCWGENIFISDHELYLSGTEVPLSMEDFVSFVDCRVVSTSEAAKLLDCSRQNINDLVARGKLKPIKVEQKNKFFLKNEILQRQWK